MPFALWDVSYPSQNAAWAVEKFLPQTGKPYLLFTLVLLLDTSLAGRARFQRRGCYVFSKVSDFTHSSYIFPTLHSAPFIISIHLNSGNRKSSAFKLPIKAKNTLSTTGFFLASVKTKQINFGRPPGTQRLF